ncbi:hypothetical protein [Synergistes jonesii]|uniref:Uncharacterized protein n=1 Tax=Synergistes jonesii TaxID=2754 RepID=A0A073J638_9BACT|nr:hypothetical protein [Synergistes jonesii]KEJ93187.1 hypothetical protein EH55_12865 [Synergistes jonesii]OFB60700.1 hypothetical protein JS72_12035 [Synergistes jonesii]OFB64803.1 hypothetical protein JS73_02850 [Synergistes jonesii]OFB66104.1 hypothetical protein JS79_02855 [Synergistes jonesii]OFB68963.1 hypothetical protein JS78_02855 [Synergistes jonesii]
MRRTNTRTGTGKRYVYKGRTLFVREYETVNSTAWGVYFVDKKGIKRMYMSHTEPAITLGYQSEENAQYALDQFAAAYNLPEADDR